MSMKLMVKAMETKVGNPLRKLVLIKLADNANDKGECWPSYQHIADQCEISRRSVINHIAALEEMGFLVKEMRAGTHKPNASNLYHLNLNGESPAPCGESPSLGGGESPAPRTSHSLEPVNEPTPITPKGVDERPAPVKLKPKKPDDQERKFNLFWSLYPRKTNKQAAVKAWQKLKPSNDLFDKIMHALSKHCVSDGWQRDGGQFIPHPSTWINGKRWDDELPVNLSQVRNTAPVEPDFHDTTWAQNMDDGL